MRVGGVIGCVSGTSRVVFNSLCSCKSSDNTASQWSFLCWRVVRLSL